LDPDYVYKSFKKACTRLGFPEFRFHDLRHTHATMLLKQGVHPKIVSERLGHARVNITLDTYSHVLPELQRDVISKLELNPFKNVLLEENLSTKKLRGK
jgi:integrase